MRLYVYIYMYICVYIIYIHRKNCNIDKVKKPVMCRSFFVSVVLPFIYLSSYLPTLPTF